MAKIISSALVFLLCCAGLLNAGEGPHTNSVELEFFFSPSCHYCHEVKEGILPQVEQRYKNTITIVYRDISVLEDYKLLLARKQQCGLSQESTVPIVVIKGKALVGKDEIAKGIFTLIDSAQTRKLPASKGPETVDLLKTFMSFTPLAVTGAGLIDGINPCAFTVIVFFISFLALQGYRRRDLVVIGSFFICAVFLTYLLLGVGLFAFFYSLKSFWVVRRVINTGIGIFSVFLGSVAVYDFVKFKKTGNTEETKLQLPKSVKAQIHKVIGMHYRKGKDVHEAAPAGVIMRLIVTAFFTGFLVSLLEAVCTGQTYLPTITFILKTTPVKIRAFCYLVWYNLMFIAPLVGIFLCALFGATSADFSKFLQKHFLTTKVLMAILFFGLGIFLLWRG